MSVHLKANGNKERVYSGTCISVESLGFSDGYGQYVAEVRPWFWLLTRTQDCRIFQEMNAIDIIKEVFSQHGFSDFEDKTNGSFEKRGYCVQYRETDFDFMCRLMEEEGIYYYFDNSMDKNKVEKLVFADGVGGHPPVPLDSTLTFHARDGNDRRREDHVAEWAKEETLARGRVTLNDYDFLAPTSDFQVGSAIKSGTHNHNKAEVYDYPGKYRKSTTLGENRARVRMESEAVGHQRWRGAASVRTLGTGYTFKLKDHPDNLANIEYLVTDAVHYVQVASDFKDTDLRKDLKPQNADFPEEILHVWCHPQDKAVSRTANHAMAGNRRSAHGDGGGPARRRDLD